MGATNPFKDAEENFFFLTIRKLYGIFNFFPNKNSVHGSDYLIKFENAKQETKSIFSSKN